MSSTPQQPEPSGAPQYSQQRPPRYAPYVPQAQYPPQTQYAPQETPQSASPYHASAHPPFAGQATQAGGYPARPSTAPLNVPGLLCLILLGLHGVILLVTPFVYRATGGTDGFQIVSDVVTAVAILFAIALIVLGAVGARSFGAPRLRWAAIGGLVCGSFDLAVQLGSHIANWLAFSVLHY